MRANQLLKHNIQTLLRVRGESQRDLAAWCHRSESWISKIFKETRREFSIKDLDRIAEFFGIATYQLLQPGISALTERRTGLERRSVKERRIGQAQRFMMTTAKDIDGAHPRRRSLNVVASSPLVEAIDRIATEATQRINAAVRQFENAGERPAGTRKPLTRALPSGGPDRPPDAAGTKKN